MELELLPHSRAYGLLPARASKNMLLIDARGRGNVTVKKKIRRTYVQRFAFILVNVQSATNGLDRPYVRSTLREHFRRKSMNR